MKKTGRLFKIITSAVLVLTTVMGAAALTANAAEKKTVSVKEISSKNWMKYLKDDIKLTELNIPGAHDAAMVHSTAVYPASDFTLTQNYHIGKQTWSDSGAFRKDKQVSEDGLLERGVRYLDIRYGFTGGDRKHSDITNASSRLKLVHGGFTAEHKVSENALGMASCEKTNNEKLMSWIKTFLTENPSETVILDISTDDSKENNPKAASFAYDFYKQQAENPNPKYPPVYVGNHVPTLGEARGKLVILTDINANYYWNDVGVKDRSGDDFSVYKNGRKIGDWAFKNCYTKGDSKKKSFGLAVKDDTKKYAIFKDNYWEDDNLLTTDKWQWVKNGLNDAEPIMTREKKSGCDAFMLNFASSNTVKSLSGPKFYAERMNPRISEFIKGNQNKFYGVVAMDFGGDSNYRMIFETNFNRLGINN